MRFPYWFLLFGCSAESTLVSEVTYEEVVYKNIQVDGGFVYDQAVDILFVVDESGSMADEQSILQQSMYKFYEELVSENFVDLQWRVGIKSTDKTDGGVYNYVDWDSQNPLFHLGILTTYLQTNIREEGFSSALSSMANDDFFHRPEADLLLIYISDEEEQSNMSVEEYKTLTDMFKQEPFIVTESAIVATYESEFRCNNADVGQRYMDVSEVVVDICDTNDWINTLDYAAEHIPTLNTTWYLSETPLFINDIIVQLDGNDVNGWTYVEDKNAIVFDSPPTSGSYVTIAYYY